MQTAILRGDKFELPIMTGEEGTMLVVFVTQPDFLCIVVVDPEVTVFREFILFVLLSIISHEELLK